MVGGFGYSCHLDKDYCIFRKDGRSADVKVPKVEVEQDIKGAPVSPGGVSRAY